MEKMCPPDWSCHIGKYIRGPVKYEGKKKTKSYKTLAEAYEMAIEYGPACQAIVIETNSKDERVFKLRAIRVLKNDWGNGDGRTTEQWKNHLDPVTFLKPE